MWMEARVAWYEVLSWHLPGVSEKNHEELESGQSVSLPKSKPGIAGHCEHGHETSGVIKGGEFLDQVKECESLITRFLPKSI
jgi:hypothetical protein